MDEDVRMGQIRPQFTTYAALSGSFAYGSAVERTPGAPLDLVGVMTSKWDLWGWWSACGESAPQLKAIGQQLTGTEPSSYPVERSFSLQKSVRSLVRNIFTHERVSKLVFSTPT